MGGGVVRCSAVALLALLASTVMAADAASASSPPASSAASMQLRREDDGTMGAFAKAAVGALLVAGAGVAIVTANRRRTGGLAKAQQARLRAVAHLRLGPKCAVHLVEADGQAVLVAVGEDARLLKLGAAVDVEEGA